ncbi:hypothetical protein E2320_014473 [Naja naja]|nr:hypothetical protein E2320_014473 [Naja naja]
MEQMLKEGKSGSADLEEETEGGKLPGATQSESEQQPEWASSQKNQNDPFCGVAESWEIQWQRFLQTSQPTPNGWKNPMRSEDSPWENPKAFLLSFEQVAEACHWPREEWAAQLFPALSGEAEEAELLKDDPVDFDPGDEELLETMKRERVEMEISMLGNGWESGVKMDDSLDEDENLEATYRTDSPRHPVDLPLNFESKQQTQETPMENEKERLLLAKRFSTAVIGKATLSSKDKTRLFSKYGRKYHYRVELDMIDSSEDFEEWPSSEEDLQCLSDFCGKEENRRLEKKCKFSGKRNGNRLNRYQRSYLEEEHDPSLDDKLGQ